MTSVAGYGTMFGGKAPALICNDFMSSVVNRKTCGEWPKPKEPFVSAPFFGTYAKSGGPGGVTTTPSNDGFSAPTTPDDANGDSTGRGGTQYPPDQYEAPPQSAPKPQTPPRPRRSRLPRPPHRPAGRVAPTPAASRPGRHRRADARAAVLPSGAMAKEEKVEFEGEVVEALPNAMFKVKLDNGHEVLGHVAGKMRRFRIRILPGDRVRVEV